MLRKINISRFLTISFSVIIILAVFGFLIKKEYNFIYNSIAIYFSYLIILYFEKKKNKKIKNYIKVLVIMTFVFHNIVGQYYKFYNTNNWFDKGLHMFGTFSFSLLFYNIFNLNGEFLSKSKIFIFTMVISVGITAGVFLEILEFILDSIINTKNQHSLMDTNIDLIFNIFGGVIAGILVVFNKKSISK
ncbi:hypothetical protein [Tepidibacter mesophilus]|uniref:hypothetical protein n=1 Tax=Tepidibacter mesophilus TaxID=655607 RepID=UPI000C07DD01|nr:hypothetical protein [Tepidibacter mesophilus]